MWWVKAFLSKTRRTAKPSLLSLKTLLTPNCTLDLVPVQGGARQDRIPRPPPTSKNSHQLEEQMVCCVLRLALDAFESWWLELLGSLGYLRMFLEAGMWVIRISLVPRKPSITTSVLLPLLKRTARTPHSQTCVRELVSPHKTKQFSVHFEAW